MDQFEILKDAIANFKTVIYQYSKPGKTLGQRVGTPYVVYIVTGKDGSKSIMLDIVQISGVVDSDEPSSLPALQRDELVWFTDIKVLGKAPAFKPGHPDYNSEWEGYVNAMAKVATSDG